jgi:hypothetical protein
VIGGLAAKHTLGRHRPVMVPDGRGGEEATWPNPADPAALPGWALDAGNTLEDTQNRDGALIQWTARGPYAADVERHDHIIVFGEEFEIDGDVRRQPGPTDLTSHTILLLKRWVG